MKSLINFVFFACVWFAMYWILLSGDAPRWAAVSIGFLISRVIYIEMLLEEDV